MISLEFTGTTLQTLQLQSNLELMQKELMDLVFGGACYNGCSSALGPVSPCSCSSQWLKVAFAPTIYMLLRIKINFQRRM
jgi:hypothetical protein